ncbi:hypothetical protein ABZ642_14700 [Streptomyces sp. NPDC007157]|uniref:hypothetical protein n=1 Tax=Streptomyces sp. NPDC007157 TaxID=3154681 RepID=UPI0033C9BF5F
MATIVGVPGAGHYRPGADHDRDNAARTRRWAKSLADGLGRDPADVDLVLAPYARHLHTATPRQHGSGVDELPDDARSMLIDLLDAMALPGATAHGRLTVPLRHAVAMAADSLGLDGRLTDLFVAVFFRELATYLQHPNSPRRLAARGAVAEAIRAHTPDAVIAHSLGTVTVFEALHEHPELEVGCLITLGSPLALQGAVFPRLVPGPVDDVIARPPGVARWVNVSDPGDLVTIARPFTRYFPEVDVDVDECIGLFDFHHAVNYLRCTAVAAELKPLIL